MMVLDEQFDCIHKSPHHQWLKYGCYWWSGVQTARFQAGDQRTAGWRMLRLKAGMKKARAKVRPGFH
ncbi:hypothetical protein EMIT047CA2_60209 [Pseudomonas soli]